MRVNRIHPDDSYREKMQYILSLTMEERLLRHKLLIDKIYEGKPRIKSFDGCVVRKIIP